MSGEELLRVEGLKRSFQTESGEQTILKSITISINKEDLWQSWEPSARENPHFSTSEKDRPHFCEACLLAIWI